MRCFLLRMWSGYWFPQPQGADDQPALQRCPAWPLRAATHSLVCKHHFCIPRAEEERALRGTEGCRSSEATSSRRAAASWPRWGGPCLICPPTDGRVAGGVRHWGAARRVLGTCSPSSHPGTWPWLKGQGQEHPCLRSLQRSLQEGNLQPVTCLN